MTSHPADPTDRPRGQARPRATRPPAFPRPADVVRELATLLRAQGLHRLYSSACTLIAVISIANGLTVWTDGRYLTWTCQGTPTSWPADDTHHAAEHLARLARQPAGGAS
ncbi:MAG TPA: hypothetical protein VGH27_04505 [Streptosporangiaceae bacterium]|jgi:hypothetical protein